ncbi:hypothetical protein ACWEPI_04355 [Streptomyces sp. NPDC004262]
MVADHRALVVRLHTFYAVAGRSPVLVHNCNDIVLDGEKFPELTWRGTVGPKDSSLGTVYWENRAGEAAGSGFFIKLVRVPKPAGSTPSAPTCRPATRSEEVTHGAAVQ